MNRCGGLPGEIPSDLHAAQPGCGLPEWRERTRSSRERISRLATDMARLEWASVVAFDGPEELVLGPGRPVELGARMTLRLDLM